MQYVFQFAFIKCESSLGTLLMSGDNRFGKQPLKFYLEEMTETKQIAVAHFEKKLFPESNSIIHLHRKQKEIKVLETSWKVLDAA